MSKKYKNNKINKTNKKGKGAIMPIHIPVQMQDASVATQVTVRFK